MRLPKRILACTDFSVGGDEAVAYAVELAAALGADVLIAHLFDGFIVTQHELMRPPDSDAEETRRIGGLSRLHELSRRLARPGVATRCLCEHGNPRSDIPRLAQREGADLIVLGRYGQSGLGHMFMGSVTDAIVRNASMPVLAVGNGVRTEKRAGATDDAVRERRS